MPAQHKNRTHAEAEATLGPRTLGARHCTALQDTENTTPLPPRSGAQPTTQPHKSTYNTHNRHTLPHAMQWHAPQATQKTQASLTDTHSSAHHHTDRHRHMHPSSDTHTTSSHTNDTATRAWPHHTQRMPAQHKNDTHAEAEATLGPRTMGHCTALQYSTRKTPPHCHRAAEPNQ